MRIIIPLIAALAMTTPAQAGMFDIIEYLGHDLGSDVSHGLSDWGDSMKKGFDDFAEPFEYLDDKLNPEWHPGERIRQDPVQAGLFDWVEDADHFFTKSMPKALKEWGEDLGQSFVDREKESNGNADNWDPDAGGHGGMFNDNIPWINSKSIFNKIGDAFKDFGNTPFIKEFTHDAGEAFTAVGDGINDVGEGFLTEVVIPIGDHFTDMGDLIADEGNEMKEDADNGVDHALHDPWFPNGIAGQGKPKPQAGIFGHLADKIDKGLSKMADGVEDGWNGFADGVNDGLEDTWDEVFEPRSAWYDDAGKWFIDWGKDIKHDVEWVGKEIRDGLYDEGWHFTDKRDPVVVITPVDVNSSLFGNLEKTTHAFKKAGHELDKGWDGWVHDLKEGWNEANQKKGIETGAMMR